MRQQNAATLCAFALTIITLYLLSFFSQIPVWSVFIAWACFFHIGGGADRAQAFGHIMQHMLLGAVAAWLSAIALLHNPFEAGLAQQLWGPVLIGFVIALLFSLGRLARFSITPVVIYAYASIFAYASTAGLFSLDALLSLSLNNALLAVMLATLIGASAAYLNGMLIDLLSRQQRA
jgi:hypothetical protein